MSTFRCPVCDYVYDETVGAPREGFPPGTPWATIPDDWPCPDCGVREKIDFLGAGSEASGPNDPSGAGSEASKSNDSSEGNSVR